VDLIHVSRSSRKGGSAQGAARREEIFSDPGCAGHITFSAYMVRPDCRVGTEREEQKQGAARQRIDPSTRGFPRPQRLGRHRWRETVMAVWRRRTHVHT